MPKVISHFQDETPKDRGLGVDLYTAVLLTMYHCLE